MKKVTSYSLPVDLIEGLNVKSFELSAKRGRRVTAAQVIEEALLKFGVKPINGDKDNG